MTIDVDAVYEDGVLKPERSLALKEKARVHVTIQAEADQTPAAKGLLRVNASHQVSRRRVKTRQ